MNWVARTGYFARALPSVTCRTALGASLSVGGDLRGGESPDPAALQSSARPAFLWESIDYPRLARPPIRTSSRSVVRAGRATRRTRKQNGPCWKKIGDI